MKDKEALKALREIAGRLAEIRTGLGTIPRYQTGGYHEGFVEAAIEGHIDAASDGVRSAIHWLKSRAGERMDEREEASP